MEIDIGDFHEEEQVGTIDDQGNLETESGALEEVARPLIEEGIASVFPFSAEGEDGEEEIAYREFVIEPGTEGFLREFVDALPSPYDCDLERLDELPTFDPEKEMAKAFEKNDFPPWCRSCGERRRMSGSFVCPTCHPDEDEDEYSGELVAVDEQEKGDNAVTTGDGGYSNATYGGVAGTTLNYDHWESEYMNLNKAMKEEGYEYHEVDDLLFNAFKRTVWWQPTEGDDLSKAPDMWASDDQVPQFVKDLIAEVIGQNVVFDRFENLPHTAALTIQQLFEDNLRQPQGWSIHSLVNDLKDAFPSLNTQQAETIARTETAAIMNSAREEAYEQREDSDEYEFYWSNAQDHRTTDLCNDIIEEIESRGDAVPMDELRSIVKAASRNYDYGTPERVDEWMPHFNCRSSFVREVYL